MRHSRFLILCILMKEFGASLDFAGREGERGKVSQRNGHFCNKKGYFCNEKGNFCHAIGTFCKEGTDLL